MQVLLLQLEPDRVLDFRPGFTTIDGQSAGIGQRPAGSTTQLSLTGRAGTPTTAQSAVINLAVTVCLFTSNATHLIVDVSSVLS